MKLIESIKAFYRNHIQKTLGYLIGSLVGLDLAGYAEPIKGLIGQRWYYGLVLAAGLAVSLRAHQAKPSAS